MTYCMTCGKLKYKYKYILYSAISLLISDCAFGINYHGVFNDVSLIKIFPFGGNKENVEKKIFQHYYIRQIFCYFGTCIVSIILYKLEIEKNKSRSESIRSKDSSNLESNSNSNSVIKLIYESNDSFKYSNLFVMKLLFLILLWVIEEKFVEKLNYILKHLDFWMFELIFLSYFCKKYLHIAVYKHQILAMFLTILPCTLKIVTIILSFFDKKSKKQYSENFKRVDDNLEILYVPYPWLIPIGLFIYFGMKIMRAYIKTYIKWYMDIKYISITKLLMLYGIIGTIFYTIICTITTFAKCSEAKINDYFCQTKDEEEHKYFANFRLYFTEILFKYPLQEIILLIIGILGFSFYKFFSLMIIKNLTPIHLVFSLPFFVYLHISYI